MAQNPASPSSSGSGYECECDSGSINDPKYDKLKNVLPDQYEVRICSFVEEGEGFIATIRLRLTTEEEAKKWQKEFQEASKTTMRVRRTFPGCVRVNLYKIDLRCQHKTRTPAKRMSSKNTECDAKMMIIVRRTDRKRYQTKDNHMPEYPMIVRIHFNHNHPINCADILRHRDVSESVKEKFLQLYEAGHTPSSALEIYKCNLQVDHPEDYMSLFGDRAIVPSLMWCFRLYYETHEDARVRKRSKGPVSRDQNEGPGKKQSEKSRNKKQDFSQLLTSLAAMVVKLNSGQESPIIKMSVTDENQLVIAICTPLMKRTLESVEQSKELIFVDSPGKMDRHGARVYLLMTYSCAGGIPVGCLITTSESQKTIQLALNLYQETLPKDAFYGRGQRGPYTFMTDDSEVERNALHLAFPESLLILCVFRVLQAAWRWLWDDKNCIAVHDRPPLFWAIKDMIYQESPQWLDQRYQEGLYDARVQKYPEFVKYLQRVYGKREQWAVCYRDSLRIRGNSTFNYCETAMRVLRDKIINRTKAFNPLQLVDFIVIRMESYYERRLLNWANNRHTYVKQSRLMPVPGKIKLEDICQISTYDYTVPCETVENKFFHVNVELGICTCYVGCNGGPCKHQAAVLKKFPKAVSLDFIPTSLPDHQQALHKLATGQSSSSVIEEKVVVEVGSPETSGDISIRQVDVQSEDIETRLNVIKNRLDTLVSDWKANLDNHVDVLLPAFATFLNSASKINSVSALSTALTSFGQYSGLSQGFQIEEISWLG